MADVVQNDGTMIQSILPLDPELQPGQSGHEYLVLRLSPGEPLELARRALAEHTEYGRWELARTLLYQGGARTYWMRRRTMRVVSSLRS